MVLRKKRNIKGHRPKVPIEHTGFYIYMVQFQEAMKVRGQTKRTLHRRESDIRRFVGWCDERSLDHPRQITKPILEAYQRYLYHYRQARNGKPLSSSSQNHYLTSVRQFFKWMTQQNHLLYNPAGELVIIKQSPTLPVVLSVEEIEAMMRQPNINTPGGIRDRAILELFYSTGIRRSELCDLQLDDLSLTRKTLHIRKGKGGKDRLIPIGERALYWLNRYLEEVRALLLPDHREPALFLTDYGSDFRDNKVGDKVKRFMKHAGIDVPGSCHLLRHAMATHMLENGAELRFIQAMLGHADLSSTQIYTHVSIRKLQEVHGRTHPTGRRGGQDRVDIESEEEQRLFAALAAEEAEDTQEAESAEDKETTASLERP